MKISVKVKPNAKNNRIEEVNNNQFSVWVKARPQKGKANQAVIEVMAEYFGVAKSCVTILKGQTSKQKILVIRNTSSDNSRNVP
jgi:uncharacterized protein (TIGR00251 family)